MEYECRHHSCVKRKEAAGRKTRGALVRSDVEIDKMAVCTRDELPRLEFGNVSSGGKDMLTKSLNQVAMERNRTVSASTSKRVVFHGINWVIPSFCSARSTEQRARGLIVN